MCHCTPTRKEWSGAEFHGAWLPLGYQDTYTHWIVVYQAGKDRAEPSSKVMPLSVWSSRKYESKYRMSGLSGSLSGSECLMAEVSSEHFSVTSLLDDIQWNSSLRRYSFKHFVGICVIQCEQELCNIFGSGS